MSYEPDCADCPTPDVCKAKNDCQVMRRIRHGGGRPATLSESLPILKRHPLSPAELRELDKAIAIVAASEIRLEERAIKIHEHDCPTAWAFFNKHSLGSKLPPSCLVCGQVPADVEDIAIRHMELPSIIVCLKCLEATRSPQREKNHG